MISYQNLDNFYYLNFPLLSPRVNNKIINFFSYYNLNGFKNNVLITQISEIQQFIIINKLLILKSSNNKNYKNLKDFNSSNELIEKLKDIVPIAFKDGVLDFDQLKLELGLIDWNSEERNEKYGLNWVGKNKAYFETTKTSTMTLVPQRDKSMNFDESDNIIIEGDNLEVLRLLEKSYFKKVDVIYIDPPYNTGNDFVYNDNFRQDKKEFDQQNNIKNDEGYNVETKNTKSDGRFHTNWLNMMYPRLRLARELLKDDGVIFISIDDNEQARLKLMCDEIFGEQNFIACLIWRKKNTGGGSDKITIETETEYILAYSKKINFLKLNGKEINSDDYKLQDKYCETRGKYKLTDLDRVCSSSSFRYIETLDYEILAPDGTYFKNYRNTINPKSYAYTLGKDLFDFCNQNDFIEIKKTKEGYWKAYRKQYEKVTIDRKNKKIILRDHGNSYNNLIMESNITTSSGKRELIKLLDGNKDFSFPKPVALIKHLLKMSSNKNSLILDFFAGSGTTGQAVMELNKEDGGNRKFILVQYPEKSENLENTEFEIIADITRERIKRSIKMYDYNENGFKAFKLQDSNLKAFDVNLNDSVDVIQQKLFDYANKIKEGATTEDLIYEIILRVGKLPLDIKIESETIANNKVYFDENKYFIFILELSKGSEYYENLSDVIKQIYKDTPIHVFLNDTYFKNDQDKINFNESIKNIEKRDAKIEVVVI